jgi:hypothetical protein
MVPALRAEFRTAVDQVNEVLTELDRKGYLPAPWLGDETSSETAVHYTNRALQGPGSSRQALTAYRDELTRVHDTLHQMEADYLRNENQTADTFRLQA